MRYPVRRKGLSRAQGGSSSNDWNRMDDFDDERGEGGRGCEAEAGSPELNGADDSWFGACRRFRETCAFSRTSASVWGSGAVPFSSVSSGASPFSTGSGLRLDPRALLFADDCFAPP